MAGDRARGATLYCTLEPCCHVGATGPCVGRIVDAGIAPRRRGGRRSESRRERPRASRICGRTASTSRSAPAPTPRSRLNQPFFTLMREGRPFVILKAATSLDGCLAAAPGERTDLTSPPANRHAHVVRAEVDAIGVGVGTILVDDPLLTAAGGAIANGR